MTVYLGQLGRAAPMSGAAESDTGIVTITLIESAGTPAEAMFTLAKPGLRQFGDSMHVYDRRSGALLVFTEYGYYNSDSFVFRANAFRYNGEDWGALKSAIDADRARFELHAGSGVDTAGLRSVSRQYTKGKCT